MTEKLQIGDICKVTVRKFDPSRDEKPYDITCEVPYTREMRVLEVIDYIVEVLGKSIAYQWYCGVKKCGGCGMRVNGKPTLACWEPAQAEMLIEPMGNLPVLRDLAIDRTRYEQDLVRMMPWLQRGEEYPGFPEPLTPDEMGHSIEMMHCIECQLCTSVCPAYTEGSRFVGPAALVQLARFALDPRDDGPRAKIAVEAGDIQDCVSCYECVEACPTHINVLEHAIDPLREMIVNQEIGDIAHHNKIYRELVMEQGVVNPSTLLLRSRGIRIISEFSLAFRMWQRGRLTISKVANGLLRRERLDSQDEIANLADAVQNLDKGKVQ